MPFTPSHVVAVLPLTRGRAGRFFDGAALAVGAMVPDLPYFVPPYVGSRWTHAWFGPPTLDLVLGLVVLAVWRSAVPGLVALSPGWLRVRVPGGRPRRRPVRDAVSVVVGATTHVGWDAFSHAHRWGTDHVAWLTSTHGPLAGYTWVQYGSGVLGLVVLALWLVAWAQRTRPRPAAEVDARRQRRAWLLAGAALVVVVAGTWLVGALASGRWLDEATAVAIASRTIGAGLAVLAVLALLGRRVPAWVGSPRMEG